MEFALPTEIIEELEELIEEEIQVLRALLSNFTQEEKSVGRNEETLSNVLEERLNILAAYEELADKLIEIVLPFIGQDSEWTLYNALDKVGDLIGAENIELLSKREQLLALLVEINNRNNATDLYVKKPIFLKEKHTKKLAVEVLDPEF